MNNNNTEISNSEKNNKSLSLVDKYCSKSIMTSDDFKALAESSDFMVSTYETVPMYRPLIIKLFGVLGNKDFPTVDSRFHQCKVEAEVHSNELIRELHELQLQKNSIDRAEYLLKEVMQNKYEKETDIIGKKEIEFDMKDQVIIISKKKFEYVQLEKKIKYRISEINEWRLISEKLFKSPDYKNQKYEEIMVELLTNSYSNELKKSSIKEDDKQFITSQLNILNTLLNKT